MDLLNLGCGNHFHTDWTNVDFVSHTDDVIAHDLKTGIPFQDNSFDVVYHSHVLEHFSKQDAPKFLNECYRVLRPGGIIRIAVPDLEVIVREYLDNMQKASLGDKEAEYNYEWIMLELFDQTVRNNSGGQMIEYLRKEEIPNLEYVYKRIGYEGRKLREVLVNESNATKIERKEILRISLFRKIIRKVKSVLKRVTHKSVPATSIHNEEFNIGSFRLSGEIHQWMYDKYSITKLLSTIGFRSIEVQSANTSQISNWNLYLLDSMADGSTRKPDSLFVEARK